MPGASRSITNIGGFIAQHRWVSPWLSVRGSKVVDPLVPVITLRLSWRLNRKITKKTQRQKPKGLFEACSVFALTKFLEIIHDQMLQFPKILQKLVFAGDVSFFFHGLGKKICQKMVLQSKIRYFKDKAVFVCIQILLQPLSFEHWPVMSNMWVEVWLPLSPSRFLMSKPDGFVEIVFFRSVDESKNMSSP